MASFRYAVSVMPKPGILDPQGRAVEQSLPHLQVDNVREVRVGRRVELTVDAPDEASARAVVDRLAGELFANPLIETWAVEPIAAASSTIGVPGSEAGAPAGAPAGAKAGTPSSFGSGAA